MVAFAARHPVLESARTASVLGLGKETPEVIKQPPTAFMCLRTLKSSRSQLQQGLDGARLHLEEAQSELSESLDSIVSEFQDLMDQAAFVFMGYMMSAHQMKSLVLPGLKIAVVRTKRTSVASMLGVAQASLEEMRKSAQDLRLRYTRVSQKVLHLASKMQATLKREGSMSNFGCLLAALGELGPIAVLMQDGCSLQELLRELEGTFAEMEASTEKMRGTVLGGMRRENMSKECGTLCATLEELCQRCCTGNETDA